MEEVIYTEAIARLKSADALAFYTSKSVSAPQAYHWFQDQFEQALAATSEENRTVPFDFPAILFEFSPTTYSKGNTIVQDASGELTLHIGQLTYVDGREDALTHADFKDLLKYADIIADVLNGYYLPCSARLILASVEKDHTNRPVMIDKVRFTWQGKRRREGVPVVPEP